MMSLLTCIRILIIEKSGSDDVAIRTEEFIKILLFVTLRDTTDVKVSIFDGLTAWSSIRHLENNKEK